MSQEDLEKRVRDSGTLVERLDKCHEMIGKMCKEGRPPKMTIPVQWHDEDIFISVTLQDAIRAQQSVQADVAYCVCSTPYEYSSGNLPCGFCGKPLRR